MESFVADTVNVLNAHDTSLGTALQDRFQQSDDDEKIQIVQDLVTKLVLIMQGASVKQLFQCVTMDIVHRIKLKRCRNDLVKDIMPSEIEPDLIQRFCLSDTLIDDIRNQPGRSAQVGTILDIVETKGPDAYWNFRKCLQSNCRHLANALDNKGVDYNQLTAYEDNSHKMDQEETSSPALWMELLQKYALASTAMLTQIREQYDNKIQQQLKENCDLVKQHQTDLDELGRQQEERDTIKNQHQQMLDTIRKHHEKQLEVIEQKHQQELETIQQQKTVELETVLRQDKETIEKQHQEDIQSVAQRYRQDLETTREHLQLELEKKHQQELETIRQQHENELGVTRQKSQKELRTIQQEHQQEVKNIQDKHEQELERIKQQRQRELRSIQRQDTQLAITRQEHHKNWEAKQSLDTTDQRDQHSPPQIIPGVAIQKEGRAPDVESGLDNLSEEPNKRPTTVVPETVSHPSQDDQYRQQERVDQKAQKEEGKTKKLPRKTPASKICVLS